MDRLWIKALEIFCFGLAYLLINCGSADTDEDYENITTYDAGKSPVVNKRDYGLESIFDYKKTKNTSASPVTEILIETGCPDHKQEFAVAKNHEDFGKCERIMLTAKNHDVVLDNETVNFLWFVADPNVVELDCAYTANRNVCRPKGKIDIFDLLAVSEPETSITACVINNCLEQAADDCENLVCADIGITSIFNLEGGWNIHSDILEKDLVTIPYQDGRRFTDDDLLINSGLINGLTIQFEMIDRIYTGQILSQDSIHGTVLDSTDMNVIGEWFAERLSP
ncbi:MAG: hypothetical protein ABIB04_01870 [Patescibacteria group bacterium]